MFHYVAFLGKICNVLDTNSDTVIKMEKGNYSSNEVRTVELGSALQFTFTFQQERSYDSFFLFRPNESYTLSWKYQNLFGVWKKQRVATFATKQ